MKINTLITALFLFCISFTFAQQPVIERSQLIGTWEQVDSLGNPVIFNGGLSEYKIITPETFSVIQVLRSKGYMLGLFLGTYVLENDTYIENISYAIPNAASMVGSRNLFFIALKNDLLYINGMNNSYKQIWKKMEKLPEPVVEQPQTDVQSLSKRANVRTYTFSGGDGSSIEKAVVIKQKTEQGGMAAQYYFIETKYGVQNRDWKVMTQSCTKIKNRMYDTIIIRSYKFNKEVKVYFDITAYYSKF